MIQQAYKYVSLSLWPCLMVFDLKITNILKSSGWGLEKSDLPWEHNFFSSHRCYVIPLHVKNHWVKIDHNTSLKKPQTQPKFKLAELL